MSDRPPEGAAIELPDVPPLGQTPADPTGRGATLPPDDPSAGLPAPGEPGPRLWSNWHAYLAGRPTLGAYEATLYTDAHVTGSSGGAGPYRLMNALGSRSARAPGGAGPGVVLRVEHHAPYVVPDPALFAVTSTRHYVGTGPESEAMATLLSLVLGARFRSGGESRVFDLDDEDPRGRPL